MWNVHFVLITFIFLFNQAAFAKELAGEVVSVAGIAFIRPDKSEGLPKTPPRAQPGDNVYAGDVINTSSEGAVKILMRDKTIVDIGASSLFKVDEYIHNQGANRKAKMDLVFGKVRVAVTKKLEGNGAFQVKTKGATMGVRGTEFIAKAEQGALNRADKAAMGDAPPPKTEVIVTQGQVNVATAPVMKSDGTVAAAPKEVALTQNMALSVGTVAASPNGAPAAPSGPVKLSDSQMKMEMASAKMADNTFVAAVTIAAPAPSSEGGGRSPSSDRDGGKGGEKGGDSQSQAANAPPPGPALALPPLPPVTANFAGPIDVPGGRRDPFNNSPSISQGTKKLSVTINFVQ